MNLDQLLTLHNVIITRPIPEYEALPITREPIECFCNLNDLVTCAQLAAGWDIGINTQEWKDNHLVKPGYPERTLTYYDVNRDGVVTNNDVNIMARYLAGYPNYYLNEELTLSSGHLWIDILE